MLHFINIPQMDALNSPLLNFPCTSAANLFLIGSNYARAFQDTEKTNKDEWNQMDWASITLYSPVCDVIWLYVCMFAPFSHSSHGWYAWYLYIRLIQACCCLRTCSPSFLKCCVHYMFSRCTHTHAHFCLLYSISVALLLRGRSHHPFIHPSCCQIQVNPRDQDRAEGRSKDTEQTGGSEVWGTATAALTETH